MSNSIPDMESRPGTLKAENMTSCPLRSSDASTVRTATESTGTSRMLPCVLLFVLAFAALPALNSLQAQAPVTRILPLGDSITTCLANQYGWRYRLWRELRLNGYFDLQFTGTLQGAYQGPPLDPAFDQDHEGHWGLRADEVAAGLPIWLANSNEIPDIALLHVGTNDLIAGQSVTNTLVDIGSIIVGLRAVNPNIVVLVAEIIPTTLPGGGSIPALNAGIRSWAPLTSTANSPVIAVDQFTGFDALTDTNDGIHPNNSGDLKICGRWLSALAPQLGGFRLRSSPVANSNFEALRNLGGENLATYLTVVTMDPMNITAPNMGGFGGLWISQLELTAFYGAGAPFLGTLDEHGSSELIWDPSLLPAGTRFFAISAMVDPTTMGVLFTPVLTLTL